MDDKFLFGAMLGMIGGALLVANSVKARQMVKEGQAQVKEKIEGLKNCKKDQSSES